MEGRIFKIDAECWIPDKQLKIRSLLPIRYCLLKYLLKKSNW